MIQGLAEKFRPLGRDVPFVFLEVFLIHIGATFSYGGVLLGALLTCTLLKLDAHDAAHLHPAPAGSCQCVGSTVNSVQD